MWVKHSAVLLEISAVFVVFVAFELLENFFRIAPRMINLWFACILNAWKLNGKDMTEINFMDEIQ